MLDRVVSTLLTVTQNNKKTLWHFLVLEKVIVVLLTVILAVPDVFVVFLLLTLNT